MENCQIDEIMARRQSCRDFQTDYKIPEKSLERLLEALRLSPSAYGALNYRVLVFPQSKTREDLNSIFLNQKNFITASSVILFVADKWERLENQTARETANSMFPRPEDTIKRDIFLDNFHKRYDEEYKKNPKLGDAWSAKQVFIALGVGLVAAEALNLDACALGGFDEEALDKWLQSKKLMGKDEMAVIALALGKSAETVKRPKVRKQMKDFTKIVK